METIREGFAKVEQDLKENGLGVESIHAIRFVDCDDGNTIDVMVDLFSMSESALRKVANETLEKKKKEGAERCKKR